MSEPICYSKRFFMQFFDGDDEASTAFLYKHAHYEEIRSVHKSDGFYISARPSPDLTMVQRWWLHRALSQPLCEDDSRLMPSYVYLYFDDGRHRSINRPHKFVANYVINDNDSSEAKAVGTLTTPISVGYELVGDEYKMIKSDYLSFCNEHNLMVPKRIVI